ncbi:MAG: Ig-like domain-containing protein [Deltaproteobacteria bacterium]|nr:Ig-like domain-containing protein [Deltaproteobacteria bacterium]
MARLSVLISLVLVACGDTTAPLQTAEPGVVFTYPVDKQVDVPLGTKLIVTFSDPVVATALTCPSFCIMGPNGPANVTPTVSADGLAVSVDSPGWDPGAQYSISVTSTLAPFATNLPTGALVTFTTRSDRPRAAVPTLVAVNGGDPANPESFRPMFETSTIRLVFSEPLDPRTVTLAPGSIELLDPNGSEVAATVVHKGIAVSIDPVADLTPGAAYKLRLGSSILDLGGQAFAPQTITLTPKDTKSGTVKQVLRSRQAGDPGTKSPRTGGATNTIVIDKPIIGNETTTLQPFNLATELGDPKALGGPIAFTMRRGQRLKTTGFDVKLGGSIPSGLSTGDIYIELLTDGGGRMYRNPHQDPMQRPENDRAPLYVDFSLDVGVYSVDAKGNATLTQTVLGLQASGIATATDGVLDIETASAMDLGLLGVTSAPSNLILELITDLSAQATADTTAPSLVATFPGTATSELPVDDGIELIFSEPVDLDKLRNGGLKLETAGGQAVPFVVESNGAAIVVRPVSKLAYSSQYKLTLANVADVAGNALPATGPLMFSTPAMASSAVPLAIVASNPGAPCALNNGRCAGGNNNDDTYKPFTLAANDTLRVAFSQPLRGSSITHSTMCNAGDVRVETTDSNGACMSAVPGTLIVHERSVEFIPDTPWVAGTNYRLTLISGNNSSCDAGEVCGLQSAASFDPLGGTTSGAAGGPNFVINFAGAPASTGTFVFTETAPFTDINGSGFVDGPEVARNENAAALRITGTHGFINSAKFNGADCVASTAEVENCQFLQGAMPTTMQDAQMGCMLPDGSSVPSCIPVDMSPQAMFGTSTQMHAVTSLLSLDTDTGTVVMRLREPASGPITGYIYDKGGTPTLQVALALYMDAPDMSITLSTHDLHSKPLQLILDGPVKFLEDGRIAIDLSNTADMPVTINISNSLLGSGAVDLLVPKGLMTLQLISPPVRGALL